MSAPRPPAPLDVFVTGEGSEGAYRHPGDVARALASRGFPVRTVTVLDTETGLTSTYYAERGGA